MSLQQTTHNLMVMVSRRIRDIATVELFNGQPALANNKMALDFSVPLVKDSSGHPFQLVARLSYLNDQDEYVTCPIVIKAKFQIEHVTTKTMWDAFVEILATPLVSRLKQELSGYQNAKLLALAEGDMYNASPYMKRIWIK